jgi:hypothetical protein
VNTKRVALAAMAAMLTFLPAALAAQQPTVQQQAYEARRRQLVNELEQTQEQLSESRSARVQLASRIEAVIAQMLEARAQALLMSNEANALQQLDAILTTSQDNLLAQRDRFLAIGDAARRRAGSTLVVLVRADSSTTEQRLESASLTVDNVAAETRTYSVTSNSALRMGAVDQLYRAPVLPTPHTVTLTVTLNGQSLSQSVNVSAPAESVTYVQFAVRNGQLIPTTWTSRGTTPF